MTSITFFIDKNNKFIGFSAEGHSGFAESGKDIYCAAISTLIINTINAIDCFTANTIEVEQSEDMARIVCYAKDYLFDNDAQLLIQTMELGLNSIKSLPDGKKYLKIRKITKEVLK